MGVTRQRDDCLALAAARGWTVAAVLTDNDLSAYSGKVRPAYAQLLAGIRAGSFDAVIAWHPDRLHRSPLELEEFITIVEAHRVTVETVQAGQWDLSTPSGRLVARQLGSVARYESEHRGQRVRRALEQNAQAGRAHGRRAYGWSREYDPGTGHSREVVEPTEATVVQRIAASVIAGDSIRGIVTALNADHLPSATGKPWTKVGLRHVVLRERNVGLRVHHGAVIGDGDWPPILDRGTWEQVRAVLADPQRRTSTGSVAAHLLSGIARCGVCGAPMRAGMNRSVPSYRCTDGSCVSRRRADVDELVVRIVVGRLARPDAVDLFTPAARSDDVREAAAAAATLRARVDNAADDYADGRIDRRQLERITARLRPQIDVAEARASIVDDAPLLAGLLGADDVRAAWDALPLPRRRAVVDLLVDVRVNRAHQGARAFDPATVEITWRV